VILTDSGHRRAVRKDQSPFRAADRNDAGLVRSIELNALLMGDVLPFVCGDVRRTPPLALDLNEVDDLGPSACKLSEIGDI
jgi:hypothetical protein